MTSFFTPTMIGLILIIIGVIAGIAGSLRVSNLELNWRTKSGRITLIFSVLHILGGLVLIFISLLR